MRNTIQHKWLVLLCLLAVLGAGAYFRFVGIDWDEGFHLHPDERFLTMVETSIATEDSIRAYFDTEHSTLNPHNVLDANGNPTFPFFVYGTFPIFLVRMIAEALNQIGYSQIHIVGRYLSGVFDLATIGLIYLIGKKLLRSDWAGILSAAFYSFAALPIQISHFFIVDNFTTFFATAAFYFAVAVMMKKKDKQSEAPREPGWRYLLNNWRGFGNYFGFALALGLAAASKINAVAIAFILPLGVLISNSKPTFDIRSKVFHLQLRNVILAGLLSFLFFRIFQPYAFTGPGFFNMQINEKWLKNITELQSLSSGLSNYPPSLQWTRRSILFPLKNMVIWGMGLAFGAASVVSLFVMFYRVVRGEAENISLLLAWNLFYIVWQAIRWNPTMRYFLLVYPTMALSAGWFLVSGIDLLWKKRNFSDRVRKGMKTSLIILCLLFSIAWGFAFTNIYRQPMTRIAASEWFYTHLEGPINLMYDDGVAAFSQPVPYRHVFTLDPEEEFTFDFHIAESLAADQLVFDHISGAEVNGEQYLEISLKEKNKDKDILKTTALLPAAFGQDQRGGEFAIDLPGQQQFNAKTDFQVTIKANPGASPVKFQGTVSLRNNSSEAQLSKRVFSFSERLRPGEAYSVSFIPFKSSALRGIQLFRVRTAELRDANIPLIVEIIDRASGQIIGTGVHEIRVDELRDFRGGPAEIMLDERISLSQDTSYELILRNGDAQAELFISGSQTAKETDWDDALPLFMYGMNPFDQHNGVYQSDLNFQMYWDDNPDKLGRFVSILDQADTIIMSSNRQWGSVTQAVEKYPLSTHLYRGLLDCELDDVQQCYIEAMPSAEVGPLGYELVETYHVQPEIFGIKFNSQKAEEALSVYDHPKVMIFKKSESFSYQEAVRYLEEIDLDKVLNIPPQEIEKRAGLLELPKEKWALQRAGGTWAELFDRESAQNKSQFTAIFLWYGFISLLGWMMVPLTRIVFSGLKYLGWGLSRLFGLVLLSFLVWMGGSAGFPATRQFIIGVTFVLFIFNAILFLREKDEIIHEARISWRALLAIEVIFLIFFLLFLLIRVGNPDLWHPYKGGEKPMDFAFFNALIKSETFPPYDPWYAGGYINYYYWGFMLAAIPTKLLGIIPSVAYNLLLPTFFAMSGIGAFTIGFNLFLHQEKKWVWGGLLTAGFVLLIGNLGTINMIFQGFQRLGETGAAAANGGAFINLRKFVLGIPEFFRRGRFNYYPGDWYWIPSRSIPGEPITEFPFFTFLYGDPHAHLFAYPITLMVINWSVSMITNQWKYRNIWTVCLSFFGGALLVGALRPTNTWDYPVFLVISCFSIIYAFMKVGKADRKAFPNITIIQRKSFLIFLITGLFIGLSLLLFQPFYEWYGQAYTSIALWEGSKTPISAYLSHWGIFLFIICSWLIREVVRWMKITPLSRVKTWREQTGLIIFFAIILAGFWGYLLLKGIVISLVAIPIILIALMLAFRKSISEQTRIALLSVCMGVGLTLVVEIVVLSGDIGRMNTVFKFYLQAWTWIALGASYALLSMCRTIKKSEKNNWQLAWQTILILLLVSGSLYPVLATADKVADRIAGQTPATLNGMDYMQYAQYPESETMMDLSQDHALIQWMQDHIEGTPRIIEANVPEYRWGSRISVYTGLPSVVGWNWHQRQQRAINPGEWVFERVEDVGAFYSTTDPAKVDELLNRYQIEYVVIGQLERIVYPADGIEKFFNAPDNLFELVYEYEDTSLLRVNRTYD